MGLAEGTHVMSTYLDEQNHIVISGDDARGGVTGHNARYVLAFGLTGVVATFAIIAIYFGYDQLQASLLSALSQNPLPALRAFAPYAAIVLCGAIAAGLLLGLWNAIAGRDENASQTFMRLRVVTQVALIGVIMTILFVSQTA